MTPEEIEKLKAGMLGANAPTINPLLAPQVPQIAPAQPDQQLGTQFDANAAPSQFAPQQQIDPQQLDPNQVATFPTLGAQGQAGLAEFNAPMPQVGDYMTSMDGKSRRGGATSGSGIGTSIVNDVNFLQEGMRQAQGMGPSPQAPAPEPSCRQSLPARGSAQCSHD